MPQIAIESNERLSLRVSTDAKVDSPLRQSSKPT